MSCGVTCGVVELEVKVGWGREEVAVLTHLGKHFDVARLAHHLLACRLLAC